MDGLLNIWKPPGPTSFEVVRRLRQALPQRERVGHGGTLDPLAEGVLPILIGQATRLSEFLEGCAKAYRACILLGLRTDTFDIQGQVLDRVDPSRVTEEAVRVALPAFTGPILQRPPAFSALKRGGQPLYRLARRGEKVETVPRPVVVHKIVLLAWEPPRLFLEVVCGRGTYVRSLAADLGDQLGCGAALEALTRLQVGPFRGEEALGLEQAEAAFREGRGPSLVTPLDSLFPGWPALRLSAAHLPRALVGALLGPEAGTWGRVPAPRREEAPFLPPPPEDRAVAYGPDGQMVAMLVAEGGFWRPHKVFAAPSGSAEPRTLSGPSPTSQESYATPDASADKGGDSRHN